MHSAHSTTLHTYDNDNMYITMTANESLSQLVQSMSAFSRWIQDQSEVAKDIASSPPDLFRGMYYLHDIQVLFNSFAREAHVALLHKRRY